MFKIMNRKKYLRNKAKVKKMNKYGMWMKYAECPECGEESLFNFDKYDAVCCMSCDIWIDKVCGEPDCPYCSGRPAAPSEALYMENEVYYLKGEDRKCWLRQNYQHKNNGKIHHARKRELYNKSNHK